MTEAFLNYPKLPSKPKGSSGHLILKHLTHPGPPVKRQLPAGKSFHLPSMTFDPMASTQIGRTTGAPKPGKDKHPSGS